MLEKIARFSSYITLLLFLAIPTLTNAAYSEIDATITSSGDVSFTCPVAGNVTQEYMRAGVYPDTTATIESNASISLACSGLSTGSFSLEDGWLNVGAATDTPDGSYWVQFQIDNVGTTDYYFRALRSGGIWSDASTSTSLIFEQGYAYNFNTQYNTRFTNLGFSTTTSTTTLITAFYIDPTEATTTQSDKNPTQIRYRYSKIPTAVTSGYGISITDALSPIWGNGTTTATFNLDPDSNYDFTISFANSATAITGITPFPLAYIYLRVTTNSTGGIATTSAVEFYDATEISAYQYQPCGIAEMGGCINNSFIYLFVPSNEAFNQFAELRTDLQTRIPFVYFYQVPNYFDTMYTTASSHPLSVTASTSIGNFTFLSAGLIQQVPFSSTLRTLIGYLLWVMLVLTIYAQVKNMFNHQEKSV